MKNVRRSWLHGSAGKFGQGLAKKLGIFALGAAFLLAPLSSTMALAASMTHLQFLQVLAQVSGESSQFSHNSSAADYVNWARGKGISPSGGWQANAKVSRDTIAQALVQMMNLNSHKYGGDNIRTLAREGISISSIDLNRISREDLVALIEQSTLQARLRLIRANHHKGGDDDHDGHHGDGDDDNDNDHHHGPPHHEPPDHKVTICHKGHTIQVDQHSLRAHLAHGDTLGACHVTTPHND